MPYQVTIELPINIDPDLGSPQIDERNMFCTTHFGDRDWKCSETTKLELVDVKIGGDVCGHEIVVRPYHIYTFRNVMDAIYFKLRFG